MFARKNRLFAGLGAALVAVACGESPIAPAPPLPAAYTLTLTAPAIFIVRGGPDVPTAVNLIHTNFTGTVALSVESLPAGVSASFYPCDRHDSCAALLFLAVDANAPTGTFTNILVRGVASGLVDRTALLALTIEVAPPAAYILTVSPTLSIVRGGQAYATVHLIRTNFTGDVALSVEHLPTGVSAIFHRGDSSAQLSLAVADSAPTGTFTTLLVRGVATGLVDRTAPLALTIEVAPPAAPFAITLSSPTLSIVQGAATPTTTVSVVRNNFAGPVTLFVGWDGEDHDVMPPGVTAAFAPSLATGDSSVLSLTVSAGTAPGVYDLFVSASGDATTYWCWVPLTLTVTARSP